MKSLFDAQAEGSCSVRIRARPVVPVQELVPVQVQVQALQAATEALALRRLTECN